MVCEPSTSVAVVQVATLWPPTTLRDTLVQPEMAVVGPVDALSVNDTVPEGAMLPAGDGVMVAVKVTEALTVEGFGAPLTLTLLVPLFTVCATPVAVLVPKFESPV